MILRVLKAVLLFISLLFVFEVEANCNGVQILNETQGEITTPGFPNQIDFNTTCIYVFLAGRVLLTFANVSLPKGSSVSLSEASFVVGENIFDSKVWYTRHVHATSMFFSLKPNTTTSGFKGLRVLYERIPQDYCTYSYMAVDKSDVFEGTGVNKICTFYVEPQNVNRLVRLSVRLLALRPGDELTIYDASNDAIIETYNASTSFVLSPTATRFRVVFRSGPVKWNPKFVFGYRQVEKDLCYQEYYGRQGSIASPAKPCRVVIRKMVYIYLQYEFQYKLSNLFIPPNQELIVIKKSADEENKFTFTSNNDEDTYLFAEKDEEIVELKLNASVKFNLTFHSYNRDVCPHYRQTSDIFQIFHWPTNNDMNNASCEIHIHNIPSDPAMLIAFRRFSIAPGDHVAFYDFYDGTLLAKYDGTQKLLVSKVLDTSYIRVVFKPGNESSDRRLQLDYRKLAQGSCVEYYFGEGALRSPGKKCVYRVRCSLDERPELKFVNLTIPPGEALVIKQKDVSEKVSRVTKLTPSDSAPVKYVLGDLHMFFELEFNATVKFTATFKPFNEFTTVDLSGISGTLLSPRYPASYIYPRTMVATYHVKVPYGHVLLNFTELVLTRDNPFTPDGIEIFDGPNTKSPKLGYLTNRSLSNEAAFLGSGNSFTVVFTAYQRYSSLGVFRFKAEYSSTTQVQNCSALKWPHSYPSRNETLPGRDVVYKCTAGYISKGDPYNRRRGVKGVCGFGGVWKPGDALTCLRICPKIAATNSTLKISEVLRPTHEGDVVFLSCGYKEDLIGVETITCTSHGNYSAPLPFCKKRPEEDSSGVETWWIGAGVGGLGLVLAVVIAVLRLCFGCFVCCDSKHDTVAMEMK